MAILGRRFNEDHLDVAFIQEPYTVKDQIKGLTGELLYESASDGRPRAGLLFRKNTKFIPITEFCNKDIAAAILEVNIRGSRLQIAICSAYLPGDSATPASQLLRDLVDFCSRKNMQLIIGCDANAHHTVWGSTNINNRGESLLEFINSHKLEILNRGNKPTFRNRIREEVLDLTLSTQYISTKISNWHVSDETSMSDHLHIRFNIQANETTREVYRQPRKTNWVLYDQLLSEQMVSSINTINSIDSIEIASIKTESAIIAAYTGSCPETSKTSNRKVPWWNNNLAKLRVETRKLCNRAKTTGAWDVYKESLTRYNREIRRAKRESWRKLCQEVNDLPSSARLHKILSKQHTNRIGLMEKPDGAYTESGKQTLELLAHTHFPGSAEVDAATVSSNSETEVTRPASENWRIAAKIFTPTMIKWAINSFEPFKSPGEDGIFPALLQRGLPHLLPILIKIFRASHAWGYIPRAWRMVRLTYIPKAGKRPCDQPKSYRPISLASFLLKTMEKILDRYIRDGPLRSNPLHKNQFAYQPGKSTTHALQQLVAKIEKSIDSKEVAVGGFLDIEGAFDNTSYQQIHQAIIERGIDDNTCRWIRCMLEERIIKSTLADETLIISAAKGCPQGGVLSPLLWSIVVDELLIKLSAAGIDVQGYADDITILVRGTFEEVISELLQRALNMVADWTTEVGLNVNPKKTTIVAFTRRRNRSKLRRPTLFGETIEYSNEVKYLGLTLDNKLNWNTHVKKVTEKARISLWTCRSFLGKTWGLKPMIAYWMYTAIARPIVTYASSVWWLKTTQKTTQIQLSKLQRLACVGVLGAMRTTPTAAMEVLLNLPPLHLYVQKEARLTTYRLLTAEDREVRKIAHPILVKEIQNDPILSIPITDDMIPRYNFDAPFKVLLPERMYWESKEPNFEHGALIWYTDGSKTNEGVGAGVYGHRPRVNIYASLDETNTVFQAEIHAIELCIRENIRKGYRNQKIYILSDSRAALLALQSNRFKSKLVWDCLQVLKKLAHSNLVTLIWVPGHSNIAGNEKADQLARKGSEGKFLQPIPFCGIPSTAAKERLSDWMITQAELQWRNTESCRQSKLFLEHHSKKRTSDLLQLNRNQVRRLTGLLTGHCRLKKHLHTIGLISDDMCRLCEDEEETAEHILCYCEKIAHRRLRLLGNYFLTPSEVMSSSLKEILKFVDIAPFSEL